MHRIKHWPCIFILIITLGACIRPFDPFITSDDENKYVVSGRITDQEGPQFVYISTTSPVEEPGYFPMSGCQVTIFDNQGNQFQMQEDGPGAYTVWMGQEHLLPGTAYQVVVNTPSGDVLSSDFDTMPACPEIDSVYYLLEDHPTSIPSAPERGLQFYLDLDAGNLNTFFYQWEVAETWEYHAAHAKEYYYDGDFHELSPPDSSTYFCWANHTVKNIFTLSTQNLAENAYQRYPLNFVNGHTARLGIRYSILLRQFALSEPAYHYWEQLRVNSNEQGGLYEKQPLAIRGNLHETTGSGKQVLGFFHASSVKTRRIFVESIEGLELDFTDFCTEDPLGHFGWSEYLPKEFPVYFYFPKSGGLLILTKECVECEMMGGTTEKPDYWPD